MNGEVSTSTGKISPVMSSAASSSLGVVELGVRLVEAVGEDAEELPEHLDRELVLLPEDLEEVGAADGDELGRALLAVTVAERGTLRMSAISPTCSPGPRSREDLRRRARRGPCPRAR